MTFGYFKEPVLRLQKRSMSFFRQKANAARLDGKFALYAKSAEWGGGHLGGAEDVIAP